MLKRKIMIAGASAFFGVISTSSVSLAQTSSTQQFVSAETPEPQKVTATRVQPSTSETTPSPQLSSALGLGSESHFQMNGFISAGAAWTNSSADYIVPYHGLISNDIDPAPLTLIGLQFTADIAHSLQAVAQIVGDGDNTNGNVAYRANVEWAFIRYAIDNYYQIQAGRFRLPAFLYSQTEQVGFTYPWVILPNEVYRIIPFDNLNGITFITRYPLGGTSWNMTVQPYYGSNDSTYTIYNNPNPDGIDVNLQEKSVSGIVATIGNDNITFRGTYAKLKLTGTYDGVSPSIPSVTLFSSDESDFYSVGMKFFFHDLVVLGEYADYRDTPSNLASLIGYYGSLGWKFGKLTPLFTYAHIHTTNGTQLAITPALSELPQDQQSYTISLDYLLNSNMDIKGSVSQITPLHGTFGLFNTDPGRRQVYLYGLSLDAIF